MLSGDNGILQRATDAKTKSDDAQIEERIKLAYHSALMEDLTSENRDITKETLQAELDKEFTGKEVTITESEDNWIIAVDGVEVSVKAENPDNTSSNSNAKFAFEIFESTGATEEKMHIGDYVNYPVYYENVATCNVSYIGPLYPLDECIGWRVLSVEGTGNSQQIKLISSGVPLNYYFSGSDIESVSRCVENLTTKFFNTTINNNYYETNSFYECGFKTTQNGTIVTTMSDVKDLFNNAYTEKYTSGENAVYVDNTLNKTFTNSNVEGQPKVQSVTKGDYEMIYGSTLYANTDVSNNNLLALQCKSPNETFYANICLAHAQPQWASLGVWGVNESGKINSPSSYIKGIRCVVTLKSNVKYFLSENSQVNDLTKTWNIE